MPASLGWHPSRSKHFLTDRLSKQVHKRRFALARFLFNSFVIRSNRRYGDVWIRLETGEVG